jgi:hypothetical protein
MVKMSSAHARQLPVKRLFNGLQGSAFATLKVVPAQAPQPPTKKPILIHFCFDQEAGETKPVRCNCHVRITKDQAYEIVDAGRAQFLLVKNPRTDKLTKFHRAIVVQQHTVDGQTLFALAEPVKPDRRDAKHAAIKTEIMRDARRILQKLFAASAISPEDAVMSDVDLAQVFEHPESFLEKIAGRKRLKKSFTLIVEHWYNNILGFHRLNVEAGEFMKDADRTSGLLVSGGYDTEKIGKVDGARVTDTGRVPAAGFRKAYWNGGWVSSAGTRPLGDGESESELGEGETFCEKDEHEPADFGPTTSDDDEDAE